MGKRKLPGLPGERQVRFNHCSVTVAVPLLAGREQLRPQQGANWRKPGHFLFHHVLAGRGWAAVGDQPRQELTAGDWFCCFPDQVMRYRQDDEDPWEYTWVGFRGTGLEAVLAEGGITRTATIRHHPADSRTRDDFAAIMQHLASGGARARLAAAAVLHELLLHLVDAGPPALAVDPPVARFDYVDLARGFMLQHFAEGLNAADVARHVGFERSYFSSLFARRSGITLSDYLATLRQERAEVLLAEEGLSVDEIAQAVGYRSSRSFIRAFAQRAGMPPGAWRRRQREKKPRR